MACVDVLHVLFSNESGDILDVQRQLHIYQMSSSDG